jgi:hypothetical protein
MALGIVSDDIFEKEIEKIIPGLVQQKKPLGRREGDTEVPDSIRKIIGDEGNESGRKGALELSSFFGLSVQSADAYKNGATSTASYNDSNPLKNHIANTRKRIAKKAARGINRALDALSDDKLSQASAPELASVARALSGVVKDMEPPTESGEKGPQVQFVIHAPQIMREERFHVIDVTE